MSEDLLAALCLMLVIEGLFLLAGPNAWKRMAEQIQQLPTSNLRVGGAVMVGLGLICLQLVRG
ncbi:DUF2065 domain-containing protein [Pseudomarimonas arenosa]|uniref:DUF2065 domain-containing protein n=1 Tax=Pseudomarimonas arenosa TaxID=2774145 RepID=A0AAW3ZP08_9GAMM|nr:DUF2065 domain-containing protein [Pseudomarimonas arenosa]MBD8527240.1 DUF2065 domain-containing protein [Pseudomarimonas arenosa]